jgi:hypothetical protein
VEHFVISPGAARTKRHRLVVKSLHRVFARGGAVGRAQLRTLIVKVLHELLVVCAMAATFQSRQLGEQCGSTRGGKGVGRTASSRFTLVAEAFVVIAFTARLSFSGFEFISHAVSFWR